MKTFKEYSIQYWTDEEFDKILKLSDDKLLEFAFSGIKNEEVFKYLIEYDSVIWLEAGIVSAAKKLNEKVVSVSQRKKMARRMSKMMRSKSFQTKKKRMALRMKDAGKLALIARKKTVQMFRNKFYPTYRDMALQQRVKVDQIIMQRYGKKIDKIAKKMMIKLKKLEVERVKKARASQDA